MTPLQAILGHLVILLLWVVLAGIVRRRRYREWIFFPVFVFSVAAWGVLQAFWPEQLYVPEVYMAKEAVQHVFRLVMAVELGIRTFRAFPGAMATLKRVVFILIVVTIAMVLLEAPSALHYTTFIGQFQPRMLAAAIWLFTAIAVLILWYRLPVSRFQKAIVLSYVLYLPIFAAYMNLWAGLGSQRSEPVGYLYQVSYLAVVSFWVYVCWRVDPPPKPEPPVEGLSSLV
jgi:hypothetical protein